MKQFSYGVIPYILTEKGIKILLCKASKNADYGFVKGKINDNESKKECTVRETFEEIGVKIKVKDLEESFFQQNKKKDVTVYLVDWQKYKKKQIKLKKDELYAVNWFNLNNLPAMSKNQRLILTNLFIKFNKLDFWLRTHFVKYKKNRK